MPPPAPDRPVPLALQLWSVKQAVTEDFAAAVGRVAGLGFSGVELAGLGGLDAAGVRAALDAEGLKAAGMHVGPARLDDLGAIAEEALTVGAGHVTCAFWPRAEYTSAAACRRIGARLGECGATLRSFGLRFSFHNHDAELALLEGRTVLDWLLDAAAPCDLAIEPDVFWLHHAGCDPARFLLAHGARCPLVHLRDAAEIGAGPVDYPRVLAAIDTAAAAEWLILEQDCFNHEPFESLRLGLAQMARWGRV
jgi:sugar phosphate isomerase/epimerase